MRGVILAFLSALSILASSHVALAVELFWNDAVGIRSQADNGEAPVLLFESFQSRGIAVDAAGDRLLWSDVLPLGAPTPGGVLREGGVRGGEFAPLVSQLTNPAGVAIDPLRGNIYWTDLGDDATPSTVYMARRDGSNPQPIIQADWLSEIEGIAVDALHGKLYFSYIDPTIDSLETGGIARADLDGSNLTGVVGGLGKPFGVAVDPLGNGLFWADARKLSPAGGDGKIARSELNGENQRIILGGLEVPFGVALDFERREIYWTDSELGTIQRSGMSGNTPFFEDVVTGLQNPTAIAIANDISLPTHGDANRDGRVDRGDVAIVAANLGRTGPEVNWSLGDFNGDSRVSLADLATLQRYLDFGDDGSVSQDDGGSTSQIATSVPEPTSWSLMCIGAILAAAWRRSRVR